MNCASRISTVPQEIKFTGAEIILGVSGESFCRVENKAGGGLAVSAEQKLLCRIAALTGCRTSGNGVKIVLQLAQAPERVKNPEQGYEIKASAKKITLTGFGEPGLLYAAVTLCELMELRGKNLVLPAVEILDWPETEKRGHFIESRFGSDFMDFEDWKSVIDDMLEKKQNALSISVYGCWSIQYDGRVSEYFYLPFEKYPLLKTPAITKYFSPSQNKWIDETRYPPMAERDFFGELIAYGKKNGVEVYPFFNTYGHNTLIPAMYPEVSAKFADGTPTKNGLCTHNPKTYEMLFDILDTIIDKYLAPNGITSFDIGLDEVSSDDYQTGVNAETPYKLLPAWCHCEKCKDIPNHKKLIDHAVALTRHLKEKGMKDVYFYSDMYYRRGRPADANQLPLISEELRKNDLLDVAVMGWWTYPDCASRLGFLAENMKGLPFRCGLKPMNGYYAWNIVRQSVRNSYMLAQMAHELQVYSFISYSGWDISFSRTNSLQAQLAWNFEASGNIEDCTRRFCEQLFPTRADDAMRAFTLLDLLNDERDEKYENGEAVLSTRTLTEQLLTYYFYSYFKADRAYLRSFPGEAMANILKRRTECERLLYFISAAAKQAKELFESIAADAACCEKMASRYAWEASHYLTLAEDYIALLRIYDLCEAGFSAQTAKQALNLAAQRKNARLTLMRRLEQVKESYLLPSHMRNQSIFMQFFADLESYLEKTPAADIKLNFTDLSPIASKQFMHIR